MPSFRAKARAVDLLGKGQIADLPTAICELWKNGYDAYADKLSCNLYLAGYENLESPIFTLSDDGTGMSREDIEEKWIVLGTDSRVRGLEALTEEERLKKPPRIPMGEKGIGRLSVAYLGPRMLMVTKKKGET
ncbi:MAG: ATP-binding protein, partial [Candidatus Thermoplasmatota archaeon]|nr:ATP-binding protein [Candidatus Thermoplasmatota archaeon]